MYRYKAGYGLCLSLTLCFLFLLSGCAASPESSDATALSALTTAEDIYAALCTDPADTLAETIVLGSETIGVVVNEAHGYVFFILTEQVDGAVIYRTHSVKVSVGDTGMVYGSFPLDDLRSIPNCFALKGKAVEAAQFTHQVELEQYILYYSLPN